MEQLPSLKMTADMQGSPRPPVSPGVVVDKKKRGSTSCGLCSAVPSKYCCPGCGIRTCSVRCVGRHKEISGCTGKRQRTGHISLSKFSDRALLSDYQFLEDTHRTIDAAERTLKHVVENPVQSTFASDTLVRQAKKRNIRLHLMPSGMTRHRDNTSVYNIRQKCMYWRVEWVFGSTRLTSNQVDENITIQDALAPFVEKRPGNAGIRQRLSKYAAPTTDPKELKVFMLHHPTPVDSPLYHTIPLQASLKDALFGTTVIEFPTLHVVLPEDVENFPILLKKEEEKVE